MKKKSIFIIATSIIILGACNMKKENDKPSKSSRLSNQKTIFPGEWISTTDSLSGISIREDKIAFFKNMTFNSEDIYEYKLIDSVYKFPNKKEDIVTEYLMTKDFTDTTYYQIIEKSDSSLTLKKDGKPETFILKQKK